MTNITNELPNLSILWQYAARFGSPEQSFYASLCRYSDETSSASPKLFTTAISLVLNHAWQELKAWGVLVVIPSVGLAQTFDDRMFATRELCMTLMLESNLRLLPIFGSQALYIKERMLCLFLEYWISHNHCIQSNKHNLLSHVSKYIFLTSKLLD